MKKFLWKVIDVVGDWTIGGCFIALGLIIFTDGINTIRKYF